MTKRVIHPGQTIGILGGGQLGRMTAMAAKHMGYRVATLTPKADSPAGQVSDEVVVSPLESREGALRLAERAHCLTFEFENVPAGLLEPVLETHVIRPHPSILQLTRHRNTEKQAVRAMGLPTAPFYPVRSLKDLQDSIEQLGLPALLKTATGGYDGKGQRFIDTPDASAGAYTALGGEEREHVLEGFVDFERELSVVIARNADGRVTSFPVTENVHRNNILHLSIAPARIPPAVADEARRLGHAIAEGLDVVGLIAVELFLTGDGTLLVNELAPRPHNSGHYTLDACRTSQFEQHVRAVTNLPLGDPSLHTPAVMLNILGRHVEPLLEHLPAITEIAGREGSETGDADARNHTIERPSSELGPGRPGRGVKLHLYGKDEARPDRKMGHLTALADTVEQALTYAETIYGMLDG